MIAPTVRVQAEDFDGVAEEALLTQARRDVGAVVAFTFASLGCASSDGFASLIAWRIVEGLAGGVLIPLVFSAIFLLFERGFQQTVATTLGGVLAVLAPALGPISGGLLTENFSWHWLFLINVAPGITTFAPAAGHDSARPQALAWNIGTIGNMLLSGLKAKIPDDWTVSDCSTFERCE